MALRGTVFLLEDSDWDEDGGEVYFGTFSGYHDARDAPESLGEIEHATAEEAIAWGRARAERVLIRRAGDEEHFAAGVEDTPGLPRWPGGPVPRRRPAGQEWRDRTPDDEPVDWAVDLELSPPDGEAGVERLAEVVGAAAWRRGSVRLDLRRVLIASATDAPQGEFLGDRTFRLELEVRAPTAQAATDDALARLPRDLLWCTVVYVRPLAERTPPPEASHWRVTTHLGLSEPLAERVAAALRRASQVTDVGASEGTVALTAVFDAPTDGDAEALADDLVHEAIASIASLGDEGVAFTRTAWAVRPA